MAGSALKRLMAEYKQLSKNPPEGIAAGPKQEENFFEWECCITYVYCMDNRYYHFKLCLQLLWDGRYWF
jgi:ubiquitin-protein ligase